MGSAESVQPRILQLDDIKDASVGGKAYGLARLRAMGLDVPPAFVVQNAQADTFPQQLAEAVAGLKASALAVRSSALGEDGAEASFAGQYETVLNVRGFDAVCAAINECVASAASERAVQYLQDNLEGQSCVMNVVVQSMVDARCAGVVFTADPVSARRDLLVIDAVAGLGEALVSGEATPDHYEVDLSGTVIKQLCVHENPLLTARQIKQIAEQSRAAAEHEGQPLDLEWAIDQDGVLHWLQARPITTLPADLNEFDTVLPRPGDVLTISNVSEMMPGAVSPLTGSFTGWCIDYGLQDMQVKVGARQAIEPQWQITAWAYGHLFLNLSGNVVMSSAVLGSNAEQTAQTLCGRIVPELKEFPPQPLWKQVINTGKLLRYALRAPAVVEKFGEELAQFRIAEQDTSLAMWQEIEGHLHFYEHAMAVHIQSSALSGFLSSIVESMVSGGSYDNSNEDQAEAVALLAGATGVESALMLEQLDALVDEVAAHPEVQQRFIEADPVAAQQWLESCTPISSQYRAFMSAHGHRGYRELCMRDPAWVDDPQPLIQSMRAAVRGRHIGGGQGLHQAPQIDWDKLSRGLRWVLPKAHNAIRRREHTKSQLVEVAHRYKIAFRHLGRLLEQEGALPDADLVNFFSIAELARIVPNPQPADVELAQQRRLALDYQQRFEFPEISVGIPAPLQPEVLSNTDGVLVGRPASRGVAQGIARVAHTLEEAAQLQPGEILITPITDIGWTPYFSLIGGLVTDLGSSVSHGAVIAREYGLPCVVNSRSGTKVFATGDHVRVDGDTGRVERLDGEQQ
ncbi:MAG: PEP-utilizing enzyme [Gammaproteobacteria bacterium]|nr:PEP-utilizing enzyme [Gammaproteobacteria bacterium]